MKTTIKYPTHRLSLILILSLLLSGTAYSQIRFGVTAGVNFNSLSDAMNKGFELDNSASGYSVGAFIDMTAGPIGLRPGLYYLNAAQLTKNSLPSTEDFDANFVSLPIDVVGHIPIGVLPFYVAAGPDFRFPTGTPPQDQTVSQSLKEPWVAGNIALGMEFKIPGLNITVCPEARYSFSITEFAGEQLTIAGETFHTSPQSVQMFMLRGSIIF